MSSYRDGFSQPFAENQGFGISAIYFLLKYQLCKDLIVSDLILQKQATSKIGYFKNRSF